MIILEKLGITPGPWKVVYDGPSLPIVASEHGEIIGGVSFRDGLDEANARLIAAAPEMLEALILAVYNPVKFSWSTGNILDIIEKATGKTWDEIKELL